MNTQFDEYANTYDDGLKELLGTLGGNTEKFAIYKIDLCSHLLETEGIRNILDFGCGTGRSISYIQKYFANTQIYGCDVSDESLKVAQLKNPDCIFFQNTSVEKMKAQQMYFDLTICACVFHHINPLERKEWFKSIVDCTNNGGYIAIFEHNILNPKTKSIILDPSNKVDDINWMLSRKDIIDLSSGLNNCKVFWEGYTLFSPFRPTWITNFERILKWLPLGAQQCVVFKKGG